MIPFNTAFWRKNSLFDPYTDPDVDFFVDFADEWTKDNVDRFLQPENLQDMANASGSYESFTFRRTGGGYFVDAINTSSTAFAAIRLPQMVIGDVYIVAYTLTLNSGTAPGMRFTAGTNSGVLRSNSVSILPTGYNEITFTGSAAGDNFLQIFCTNGLLSDFTIQIHWIKDKQSVVRLPDSRDNGNFLEARNGVSEIIANQNYRYLNSNPFMSRSGVTRPNLVTSSLPIMSRYAFIIQNLEVAVGNNQGYQGALSLPIIFSFISNNNISDLLWCSLPNPLPSDGKWVAQSNLKSANTSVMIGTQDTGRVSIQGGTYLYLEMRSISLEKQLLVRDYLLSRI
jgi:hypothetical protein